jgi:hypothetical protein
MQTSFAANSRKLPVKDTQEMRSGYAGFKKNLPRKSDAFRHPGAEFRLLGVILRASTRGSAGGRSLLLRYASDLSGAQSL